VVTVSALSKTVTLYVQKKDVIDRHGIRQDTVNHIRNKYEMAICHLKLEDMDFKMVLNVISQAVQIQPKAVDIALVTIVKIGDHANIQGVPER